MNDNIIAHLREYDQKSQSLWTHLIEASEFAGSFADKLGLRDVGKLLGMLHDLGKASQEFQNYIASAEGLIDPDSDDYIDPVAKKGEIDHSTAGAQLVYRTLRNQGSEGPLAAQILALCLASHHSGLIDCLSPDGEDKYNRRMNKAEEKVHLDEVLSRLDDKDQAYLNSLLSPALGKQLLACLQKLRDPGDSQQTAVFKYGLLVRFLFSCLIDADRLSTADFESPGNVNLRNYGQYPDWETLIERLNVKIRQFSQKQNKNEVDRIRNDVSEACLAAAIKSKGIFRLTVPTGGGKTFASLRFALHHAAHHKMERIIYVIPYTSIIDQNADEVRKVLEDRDEHGNFLDHIVLEHHSNLTPEEETRRQGLLAQNWDAPVIFTTQVQFLETLFAPGTRSARRMHQLANAVIIFDEVQTIPVRCIHMFNVALRFLVQGCGASVVLCTATQPLLDKVEPASFALRVEPEKRIIQDENALFKALKRVEVFDRRKIGGWTEEEVADLAEQRVAARGSVLIIVNTRKAAQSLYRIIQSRNIAQTFHLSTNMCPAHRLEVLGKIKELLSENTGQPVICVSTQLIEAGVDVDFGSVIRYLAGLDSIAQAAGRCNRNGLRDSGDVWIVNPKEENIQSLIDIVIGKKQADRILDEFNENPQAYGNDRIGLDLMNAYYRYYFFARSDEMRYKVGSNSPVGRDDDLFSLLSVNKLSVDAHMRITGKIPVMVFRQSFQTASKVFSVIDTPTRGVVVPYGEEGKEIINALCSAYELEKQYRLLKRAQRYSVNLLPHEFKKLSESNAIVPVQEGAAVFHLQTQYYDPTFGWSSEPVH